MKKNSSEAVSPVVGVMLMLVVTIIIAALVAALSGGLSSSKDKAPTMTIKAVYSQSDGMTIEHTGGDTLPTITTIVQIRPSKTFGNAEHMIWVVNKTMITDSTGNTSTAWTRPEGYSGTKSFAAGDIAYILPPYQNANFLQPGSSKTYFFNSTDNLGKTFWLELADENGRIFAKTEVKIQP
ncbi:type IV pilin N-terminal domain-containing protein [Methanoregula sp. UBA64]|jgi:archaeal type IV pilus assembly protein PilA|uniref:type IV pilin N-terminal domain-containing protein n=1 Tax=Methanoregula sp. UBA64 TaxID=1915554 RepID=UPI0025F1C9FD|nr:type IV pilin N-terminal domain-containing protein [Methanoregula sp. UBA64]